MSNRPRSKKERAADSRERSQFVQRLYNSGLSGLGVALILACTGLFIILMPSFFGLDSDSIVSDVIVSFAIALLLWSVVGTVLEIGEIKSFLAVANTEGWLALLFASLLLAPTAVLIFGVTISEMTGWISLVLKFLALILGLVGVVSLAGALDSLFIKPKLIQATQSSNKRISQPLPVGTIVSVTIWTISNATTFLAVVQRLSL